MLQQNIKLKPISQKSTYKVTNITENFRKHVPLHQERSQSRKKSHIGVLLSISCIFSYVLFFSKPIGDEAATGGVLFLKSSQILQENTCVGVFFIKVAGLPTCGNTGVFQ